MKKKLILLVFISLIMLLFPHHTKVIARGNQFRGILPPQRLHKSVPAEPVEIVEVEYPDIKIVINIPARKVILFDKGREVARHDVAVGQPAYKTPTGSQTIKTIIWNPWWIPPNSPWARGQPKQPPGPRNCLGPVKMMMGQGIRLHGTNADSSVGRFASHGCLRMHNEEAKNIAQYIQKSINITDDSLFAKYARNRRRSFYVNLDYPVDVNIVYEPVEIKDDVIHIYSDVYGWAKNIKQELIDALIKNGIDLRQIDERRISNLKFPRKRYEVIKIDLKDLLSQTPNKSSYLGMLE